MKKGAYTLLVTPFKKDFSLDEEALRKLIRMQVNSEITGIAPLGVTGENTLMTTKEVLRLVEILVEEAKGKKLILPDICLAGTQESIERAKMYADLERIMLLHLRPLWFFQPLPDLSNTMNSLLIRVRFRLFCIVQKNGQVLNWLLKQQQCSLSIPILPQ